MSQNTVTTEQVHELIEQLAAMTAAASITPEIVANIFEKMRNLNDQEKEELIRIADEKIQEINDVSVARIIGTLTNAALDISDENGNVALRLAGGHLRTKEFDSAANAMSPSEKAKLSNIEENAQVNNVNVVHSDAALDISDENGNVALRLAGGHLRTKKFDSRSITPQKFTALRGKKVAFIGDSITEGFYANPRESKRYTSIFQQITGSTVTNLGVASTCLASNTLNNMGSSRFVTRATSANLSNKDCIFVFGGTNDFSYDCKPIGNHFSEEAITGGTYIGTKKKAPIADTDTFAGAVHELILQIRSVAPNARLVFITPLSRGRYSSGRPTSAECNQWGDYMQDFIDAIKDICYFYAVPVIDMYTLFNQDWQNDVSGSVSSMDSDGIHPNTAGHERLANIIARWCESNLIV